MPFRSAVPWKQFAASLLDLLLPMRCAGCRDAWLTSRQGLWCGDCLEALPWIRSPLCPQCGRPFPKSPSAPDHLCGDCLLARFAFDSARSATFHSGVVRDRIHQLKFGARLHWVPPLAELLAKAVGEEISKRTHLIVPVPLHRKRLRERGFNQSGLLAGELSRRIGLPVRFDLLRRVCWTAPQTRLSREERFHNVKGAFKAGRAAELHDRGVLLVDDVFTTGTTLNECAKALRASGAAEVHALTVARAVPGWKPGSDTQ